MGVRRGRERGPGGESEVESGARERTWSSSCVVVGTEATKGTAGVGVVLAEATTKATAKRHLEDCRGYGGWVWVCDGR